MRLRFRSAWQQALKSCYTHTDLKSEENLVETGIMTEDSSVIRKFLPDMEPQDTAIYPASFRNPTAEKEQKRLENIESLQTEPLYSKSAFFCETMLSTASNPLDTNLLPTINLSNRLFNTNDLLSRSSRTTSPPIRSPASHQKISPISLSTFPSTLGDNLTISGVFALSMRITASESETHFPLAGCNDRSKRQNNLARKTLISVTAKLLVAHIERQ